MALTNSTSQTRTSPIQTMSGSASGDKAARILAKSLFRQLKESGYHNRDILTLSTELVSLITTDLRPEGKKA